MPVKIVPGFDVHDTVLPDIYDEILLRAQKAEMIALDLEFSGFPTRSPDDLYSRYEEWSKTAKTHAVLSLGMTLVSQGKVSNFDFLMRNEEPHLINPYNVSFLAREGFDFNKQLTHGIPYKPGRLDTSKIRLAKHSIVETAEEELADEKAKTIRTLVIEIFVIMRMKKIPLVLHNGFMDLLYLYQHFITDLPDKFECFVYDINAIFPGGIYDTKYMAERKIGEKKHYLPYLYVKHQYTEQAPALQVEDTICIDKKQPKNESQKENYNDNNKKEASNRRVAAKAGRKRSRDNDDDEEQALEKNNNKKQRHASGICEYFAVSLVILGNMDSRNTVAKSKSFISSMVFVPGKLLDANTPTTFNTLLSETLIYLHGNNLKLCRRARMSRKTTQLCKKTKGRRRAFSQAFGAIYVRR